jgi:hypothetical protein
MMVFLPGPGLPATVSAASGQIRCVIGATADFGHPLAYGPPPPRPKPTGV